MYFSEILIDFIKNNNLCAFTREEIYRFFLEVWYERSYKGEKIKDLRVNSKNYKKKFSHCWQSLTDLNSDWLGGSKTLAGYSYILDKNYEDRPYEVICSLYEAGYISYYSAMYYYGLVKENNKNIYFTTLERREWNNYYLKMLENKKFSFSKHEEEHELKSLIPLYPKEDKYFDYQLLVFTTKSIDEFETDLKGIRIRKIEFLFLDMTRKPQYCGGIDTVLNVFKKYGKQYEREVVQLTNSIGNTMDKARIGYIYSKILRTTNNTVESWKGEMISLRGGSRKFVPYLPYYSEYDEDWNISLNHTKNDLF